MLAGAGAATIALTAGRAAGTSASHSKPTPVAIASTNGLEAVRIAVTKMEGGLSAVEAAVAGVAVVEADPSDTSVGYGGLPNADGVVQLDACCMDGPTMRAGAVGAIENIKHPAQVALKVMQRTARVFLVGDGALRFARQMGFSEEDLLTERARKIWQYWKANMSEADDWLPNPADLEDPDIKKFIENNGPIRPTGTINLCALDAKGNIGGTTTTSGLAFKIPGRVGDSPLIGAGLFVDNEVGAAGSTGRGESVIQIAGAHTVVELMRQGKTPTEACLGALERIVDATRVPYLLRADGRPKFNVNFYALNKDGGVGGASIWSGKKFTLCRHGQEPEKLPTAYLYEDPKASRDLNSGL